MQGSIVFLSFLGGLFIHMCSSWNWDVEDGRCWQAEEGCLAPIASEVSAPHFTCHHYLRPQILPMIRPSNSSKIPSMIQDFRLYKPHLPAALHLHESLRHPTPAIARFPNFAHRTCEILSLHAPSMARQLLPLDHDLFLRDRLEIWDTKQVLCG